MKAGQTVSVDGKLATVVAVRKTAPVAVIVYDTGERELYWYGAEPSAPSQRPENGPSRGAGRIPVHSPRRASRAPETPAQAAWWSKVNSWYVRAGLCRRCAAQAAWGHQLGFSNAKPPCSACKPITSTFPTRASREWNQLTQTTAAEHMLSGSKRAVKPSLSNAPA